MCDWFRQIDALLVFEIFMERITVSFRKGDKTKIIGVSVRFQLNCRLVDIDFSIQYINSKMKMDDLMY